jgi:hypothetical protein
MQENSSLSHNRGLKMQMQNSKAKLNQKRILLKSELLRRLGDNLSAQRLYMGHFIFGYGHLAQKKRRYDASCKYSRGHINH